MEKFDFTYRLLWATLISSISLLYFQHISSRHFFSTAVEFPVVRRRITTQNKSFSHFEMSSTHVVAFTDRTNILCNLLISQLCTKHCIITYRVLIFYYEILSDHSQHYHFAAISLLVGLNKEPSWIQQDLVSSFASTSSRLKLLFLPRTTLNRCQVENNFITKFNVNRLNLATV